MHVDFGQYHLATIHDDNSHSGHPHAGQRPHGVIRNGVTGCQIGF